MTSNTINMLTKEEHYNSLLQSKLNASPSELPTPKNKKGNILYNKCDLDMGRIAKTTDEEFTLNYEEPYEKD